MKKLITLALFLAFALVAAPKADIDGAKKGVWSMDYDSVLKAAEKDDTPILMLFTGSDWCGWCKVLDEKVLSKPEWNDYAQKSLYLAYIDFPQDEKLVPEKYKNRNKELQEEFDIEGYPTILLLDAKGNPIDNLPMEKNITPQSFITKIRLKLLYSPAELEKIYSILPKDQAKELKAKGDRKQFLSNELKKADEELDKAIKEAEEKHEKVAKPLSDELSKIGPAFDKDIVKALIAAKSPDKLPKFLEAQKNLEEEMDKAMKWIQTRPEQNEENNKIFEDFRNRIDQLQAETQEIIIQALP